MGQRSVEKEGNDAIYGDKSSVSLYGLESLCHMFYITGFQIPVSMLVHLLCNDLDSSAFFFFLIQTGLCNLEEFIDFYNWEVWKTVSFQLSTVFLFVNLVR